MGNGEKSVSIESSSKVCAFCFFFFFLLSNKEEEKVVGRRREEDHRVESGVDTTTRVGPGWIESKVEETSHDETDDERMSRGRRGIRLSRPTGRPVAVESVEEERVPERVKGSRPSSMVCHDLMGRVMSRVVGTLLARSTLVTSVAAALVLLFCCCRCTRASEFPERECCDLIFPIPEPTGRSTSAPTPTGRSGE